MFSGSRIKYGQQFFVEDHLLKKRDRIKKGCGNYRLHLFLFYYKTGRSGYIRAMVFFLHCIVFFLHMYCFQIEHLLN